MILFSILVTCLLGILLILYGDILFLSLMGLKWLIKPYLTLFSWLPRRQTARIVGHHLSNSDFQLANVDFGKITRWGPTISLKCFMYPSKEMVCKVLPRPCYNKKKLVNVFKACWWISPRAYFAFFFSKKKGKILSITDCPNKFLMGTQDTQKKKWC